MTTSNPRVSADPAPASRARVTVIVSQVQGMACFHFCSISLLQGENANLQWPLDPALSLFENIERIMCLNRVAHNVARVDFLRAQGQARDYEVIYNVPPCQPHTTTL